MTTYQEWATYHATMFGLTTDADTAMLVTWCDLFEKAGYSPEELRQVSDWLALNQAPRFRNDHLLAIRDRLRQMRNTAAVAAEPEGQPECKLCGSTGRVIVPHLAALRRGQWGTCAVLCCCPLGLWFRERNPEQTTLEQYEVVSDRTKWRALMLERDSFFRARMATQTADRSLGRIVANIGRMPKG